MLGGTGGWQSHYLYDCVWPEVSVVVWINDTQGRRALLWCRPGEQASVGSVHESKIWGLQVTTSSQ